MTEPTDDEIAAYMGGRSRYGSMKKDPKNPWGESLEDRRARAREELLVKMAGSA